MKTLRTMLVAVVAALTVAVLPAQSAPAPTRLVATVGPGFTINLTKAGKRVTSLKPGRYRITVRDKSGAHNFRLRGPGFNRATSVSAVQTRTWTLTMRRGTYRYVCDPHASSMKGSFRVR
jgi:plastocyanin